MKQIYSLLALASMAVCAQAQGVYDAGAETAAVAYNTKITSVDGIVMTYGDGVTEGAEFKAPIANAALESYGLSGYTEGNGVNGNKDGGTHFLFKPESDGTLEVGAVINADKGIIVKADSYKGEDVAYTVKDASGAAVTVTDGKLAVKVTGAVVTLSVEGGKTYCVGLAGSKMGFYGFRYTLKSAVTAVDEVKEAQKADGVIYDLGGRKVDNPVAGQVYIRNGKKFILK